MKKFVLLGILLSIVLAGTVADAAITTEDMEVLSATARNVTEYNNNVAIEVRILQTLGNGMTDILKFFFEAVNKGIGYLKGFAYYCAIILGILDLTLPILTSGLSVSIAYVIPKIMKTGFVAFAIDNWTNIVNWIISFLETVTGAATGDWELASATLTQPQIILQKALMLLTPGINYCTEQGILKSAYGVKYGINFDVLALTLQTWFVLFIFVLIAAKMILTYLQFYFNCMFCIFSVPFVQIKFLKYLFENFVSGMFNSVINLFVTLFLIHLVFLCTKQLSTAEILKEGASNIMLLQYTKICSIMYGMAKLIDKIPREINSTLGGQIEFN